MKVGLSLMNHSNSYIYETLSAMKSILVLIIFTSIFNPLLSQDDQRIIDYNFEFEKGKTERLYGDRVVLRSKPTSTAEALDTLSIAQEVKIIEKSSEKMLINGLESNWYKVKVNNKVGYVLGGFIAADHKGVNKKMYLVSRASHDERNFVRVRVLNGDGSFYGHESELVTQAFTIAVYSNRGIEGIEDMIKINLFAEACGVDGGEFYLFNDGQRLIDAIHLTSVADGGLFWFHESVRFPDEEEGWENALLYTREFGESIDEELEWMKSTKHTLPIRWVDGKFSPDVSKMKFEEYD